MGNAINSVDNMLASANQFGPFVRSLFQYSSFTVTAATNNCGHVAFRRWPESLVIPAMGNGATGVYITHSRGFASLAIGQFIVALDVLLGTIDMSNNTFAANNTMPSRMVNGNNVQLASSLLMLVVKDGNLAATTPTVTVTYTNQDNNANQSCNAILPTNCNNESAYLLNTRLAAGDVGARAVTGITRSAGTSGNMEVRGLVPLGWGEFVNWSEGLDIIQMPVPLIRLEEGDRISFWDGSTAAAGLISFVYGIADN